MTRSVKLVNGRSWRKVGDAGQHFIDMLDRYSDGAIIDNEDDHSDLAALIARYDSIRGEGTESKEGCGVKYFMRQKNSGDNWSSSGFWLYRKDGSSSDFSFHKALGPEQIIRRK